MRKLMFVATMMLATLSANAQFEPGTFSIQPKMGGVVSYLTDTPSFTIKHAILNQDVNMDRSVNGGFLIGAEAEYQLTNMFSLAFGVNYSQQGTGWEDYEKTIMGVDVSIRDAKIELEYLNFPIVANVYLFKGFAVKTGVQFGALIGAKSKATTELKKGSMSFKGEEDYSIKSDCNKLDISIPIGVSYQFQIPIVIDARYNLGLNKVNKDGDLSNKNSVFQLTVGYKFAL